MDMLSYSPRIRFTWLLAVTVGLLLVFLTSLGAHAGKHRGGNGPDPLVYLPPPAANFGGWVWGIVYVNGQPVEKAVVTMTYGSSKPITTETLLLNEIEPFPIYMFGIRPLTELTATYGSTVTITAAYAGETQSRTVRLIPTNNDEIEVSFIFGTPPPIWATPQPQPEQPATDALTTLPARHLLDVGNWHSCVVVNGGLKCWGHNFYGQVGDGTTGDIIANTIRSSPVPVVGLETGVRSVATGGIHTCALLQTGKVKCWGFNDIGNNGSLAPRISGTPHDVPEIENAIDIVAGAHSTCVLLLDDHQVMCWGYNDSGQMGNGIISGESRNATPTFVLDDVTKQPLTNVTALAAKNQHVCAIVAGGVKCWGFKLGVGITSTTDFAYAVDVIPAGSGVTAIDVGHLSSCAVRFDGAVSCWGYNGLFPYSFTPSQVNVLPPDVVELAIARRHACALRSNGSVLCWGVAANDQFVGQLGVNTTLPVTAQPVTISGLHNVVDIATSEEHVCARLVDGNVKCWGSNDRGQLGDGTAQPYPRPFGVPVTVAVLSQNTSNIATGAYHTCAVTDVGGVACWGANGYGQLGVGAMSHVITQAVPVVGLSSGVVTVSAGTQHTCALTNGGAVWCWGRNDSGQLGNGTNSHSSVPVSVSGLNSGVQAIAAGGHHTCALLGSGEMRCWGSNQKGELGDGTTGTSRLNPVVVTGLAGRVLSMALGADHTCAVTESGAAQCWGGNDWGQLGNGVRGALGPTPVTVMGLTSGTTAIATGGSFSCAVVNGGVKCWGNGDNSQLANSTPTSSTVPVDAVGLTSNVADITAGGATACAVLTSGAARCWGAGDAGQLGGGNSASRSTPITVTGLTSNVVELDLESKHACARLQDRSVRCWGLDLYGQLGNGVSRISPTPVTVPGIIPAAWTYMLYLVGDNDLSSYLDNISRVLDTLPSSPDLNIVVFFDGKEANDSYLWSTRSGGDYILGLNKWKLHEADSNMGDPQTLAEFIEWSHANYPAQHYYLSIADHGRGTTGTGWDTQNGSLEISDKLTPTDIHTALNRATLNGTWKIDVLHFDSCLMALLEMAYQVKDYANYMIASENLTAAFYPYDRYARLVLNNPAVAPRDLAIGIANTYFDYEYLKINDQPRTISVLDLNQIDTVINALNGLTSALSVTMADAKTVISSSRTAVQKFDASPDFTKSPYAYYTLTPEDEYIDLYHFAELLTANTAVNPSVQAAAQEVVKALKPGGFVVHADKNSGQDVLVSGEESILDNSHGIAIFFPKAPGVWGYTDYISNMLFTFTSATGWDEFLQSYYVAIQAPTVTAIDPGVPPVLKPTIPITNHCGESEACIWGAVYLNGQALDAATVTMTTPNQTITRQTAWLKASEAYPIFVLPIDMEATYMGTQITIKTEYNGMVQERIVRFAPNSKSQEQELNLTLGVPPTSTVPVTVTMTQALVMPQSSNTFLFHAAAVASDDSSVVAYRWMSNQDGELGTTSSFTLLANQLTTGVHTITVEAINDTGVASQPLALTLTVNEQQWHLFMPLVHR